ncbi:APG9-domain-containing protein [Thozetella sp. PMI_491]|nr:APG9-domain-containing protein [Thozetella sp. PMI_491]
MSSNVFSRLMPSGRGRSFYDELRARDTDGDLDDRGGLLDEENFNHHFHEYDLEHAEGLAGDDSRATLDASTARHQPARGAGSRWPMPDDDADNDVPASLLVEPHERHPPGQPHSVLDPHRSRSVPGPSTGTSHTHWEAAQRHQKLHHDDAFQAPRGDARAPNVFSGGVLYGSAKQKAEWRWANVSNLDNFIQDIYDYYQGNGIWCILLERALHLINVAFVALFLTFLTQCVDYGKLRGSQSLSQILIPRCTTKMSGLWNLGLWLFAFYFIWKSIQYLLDLRRLFHARDFYVHLLNIPEEDMQTVTWQDIVARIMALRDQNPKTAISLTPAQRKFLGSQSKERLDASDIANRLMRRENYLIALFNKDILNLSIPLPFLRHRQLFSRTLEWCLMFSILDFVFDELGQVNQEFLKSDRRRELSAKLRARFVFAGVMMLILSPFVTAYLVIVYFLTYYNEYQKNPSALSSRTYIPLAEWKFREFNELPHLFQERLNLSHPYAAHYIDQFPKLKTEMVARTVAFITGSLATVLAIISFVDPEMFLTFEITHDRTVLFYLGVFGGIWAFAHKTVSEENNVFDPEFALQSVINYTRYCPDHWKGRLHSYDVKKEFSELYEIKLVIFLEEILSILTTPFVLLASLPKSSDQIVDFFREFTIHVDGLGYVCTFAEFDFSKGAGNSKPSADRADVRDDYYATKHGKMEASYHGFMDIYGNYALNPRPGVPGHLLPAVRHQFHPPPAWPGLASPGLGLAAAADLAASRVGRSDRARNRAGPARGPHFGPVPQPSPMASVLLDARHQPASTGFGSKSTHRPRQRGAYQGSGGIIEESLEDGANEGDGGTQPEEEEVYESGGNLDESAWQTSPTKNLSRENSGVGHEGPDAGVVTMIRQFNQAQLNRRPGGLFLAFPSSLVPASSLAVVVHCARLTGPYPPPPLPNVVNLALQSNNAYGGASDAEAQMAQPNAEPAEEEYDYESLPPNFSLLQNMAAGAFAGIAEHTVMYPIDAIKTRMQILSPTPSAVYNGVIQGTYRIASGEGILSLWRGMSSVIIGAGPAHAVYFATYEAVKHLMGGNRAGVHHPLAAATSGACATIASDALMNPFDVIKQRMQIHNSAKMYRSMLDCAKYVYKNEGLGAFYVSYPTTLSMTVPFTALQFLAYESISTSMNPSKKYDPFTHCMAGAVAGGFAAALTTPMDVIKTMLQTRGNAADPELRTVSGFAAGCRLLYRREGLRGFFKGVRPRVVTTMPSTAICWSAYEASKFVFLS